MDFSSLQPLQSQATSASNDASSLAQNVPNLLQSLQSNLTSIFSKDNPVIEARGQALADFLSTPSRARAEYLPTNMRQVEGSNLNLSPTQQDAITTSRSSAALAPLAGLNQTIMGIYGNIPQMVGKAGDIYSAQVTAAQNRAANLQKQYENSYQQILEQEKARQFNEQEARLGKASAADSSGLGDLSSIIAALYGGGQNQQDPLAGLLEPDYQQTPYFAPSARQQTPYYAPAAQPARPTAGPSPRSKR